MQVIEDPAEIGVAGNVFRLELSCEQRPRSTVLFIEKHRIGRPEFLHERGNAAVIYFTQDQMCMVRHQTVCRDINKGIATVDLEYRQGLALTKAIVAWMYLLDAVARVQENKEALGLILIHKYVALIDPTVVAMEPFAGSERDRSGTHPPKYTLSRQGLDSVQW